MCYNNSMRFKKGDTLIEAALAIGIFSMVAVAVVSVVSASTSDAQSSLEATVTREQIDIQAEALRFLQTSYLAGGYANIQGNSMERYSVIWDRIRDRAVVPSTISDAATAERILQFDPTTCREVYDSDEYAEVRKHALILNTRKLGYTNNNSFTNLSRIAEEIVLYASDDAGNITSGFGVTSTYPRIVFGKSTETSSSVSNDPGAIYDADEDSKDNLLSAEGLFIVPVADPGTAIVSGSSASVQTRSAYFDFYIRSCWYNPGAERPSTISTVIRLQDPAAIDYGSGSVIRKRVIIRFYPGTTGNTDGVIGTMPIQSIASGDTKPLVENAYSRQGYNFIGWSTSPTGSTVNYTNKASYTARSNLTSNTSVDLYALWESIAN